MSIPDLHNASPLGLISLLVSVPTVPTVSWLVRNGVRQIRKTTAMDLRFKDLRKDVEGLKTTSTKSVDRLVSVENAICDIRGALQRVDEQYCAISGKLDQLPRVLAMLESFEKAIDTIVPRNEVESRLTNTERRLNLVEHDIRAGSKP